MRKVIVLLMCAGLVNCSYARKKSPEFEKALVKGAQMRMILRVHDDEGLPVKSAKVRTVVENLYTIYNILGETDTNGTCVVEGVATGNRIEIFIEKDGYYRTHRQYCFITMGAEHEVKDEKWQPYGAEERLELRRVRKPIDLVNYSLLFDVPQTNVWIGVDMKEKALVRPYGDGHIADFEIKVDWDGLTPIKSAYCVGEIRFPRPNEGGFYAANVVESLYPYAYSTDTNASYSVKSVRVVNRQDSIQNGKREVPFRRDSVLVTRTRCHLDEKGNVQSANYGFIRIFRVSPSWGDKPVVRITYVFNPTPNDTNLEAKQ